MSAKDEFSDSEDDLEMDDAVSPETLQAIATLRASLEANPNQYEQHTQIIVLLKGAVMLEELRAAREAMSSAYPLSEELWLEWIGDETNLATSEDEKKHVLELYGRATSDYLSINIWKSYVDYAIQEYTESAEHPDSEVVVSKEYMRRLFKRADKFTGHHVPLSHTIWNVWRDFELEQLTLQYDGQAYEQTMVQSNSIVSITRKQLSEVEQFEQQLSHKMKGHDLDPSEVLSVATRSVRNCPWSGDLWENRFVLMTGTIKCEKRLNMRSLSLTQLKNIKGARQIYVRAWHAAQTMDWPEKIFEAWLAFERESGDVAAYKDALTRSRAAMKSVEVYRATQVESVYSEQVAYDVPKPAATVEVASDSSNATKKRKLSFQDNVQASKITKTDEEQNAQKQNQASINPRPLDISSGRHSDTCFVANFPANMTEKRLKELFQEYGTILRCTIPSRNTEKGKRRFAYVQFSSADEANAALRLDGRDVGDRLGLSVRISDTSKKTRSTSGPPLPRVSRHEVHVSGITNELKEEELKKLVSLHAQPTSVFIMRNSSSKGKIWANVKFDTEEDADAALALNGTMFHGKQLTVTRRVFQQKESDENQSRRERRKALQKKEEGEESKHEEPEAEVATSSTTGTTNPPANIGEEAPEPSEQDKSEEPDASSSSKLDEAKKPVATLTSMQPRSMLSRNKPKPKKPNTHLKPPTRAFRSASAIAAGALSSLTQVDGGEAASESKGEATAPAAPVAPKSNAEFRALMLSGALKKKNP
ncbi:RNA-binding protein 4F [Dissophora ornata]|nr:RNA-binding protein 4F [Dissophora ornata]